MITSGLMVSEAPIWSVAPAFTTVPSGPSFAVVTWAWVPWTVDANMSGTFSVRQASRRR